MALDARTIITTALLGGLLSSGIVPGSPGGEPMKLHPENPHCVVLRGKPPVLVASTEHYGAVLKHQEAMARKIVAELNDLDNVFFENLGGSSPALRRQLGILRAFLEGFDLPKLKPDKGVVKGGAQGSDPSVSGSRGRQDR